ncbi:MAG: protein kinase [Planctomycetes bacterium]|jgi:serine/threonine-protein kinase|nr:protein kinase [Planctomycetota bacterium]
MSSSKPPKPGPKPARVSAEALLRAGKLGRFRLLDKLGEGAMGSVLLAEDIALRRQCALKLLPCETDTPEQRMFLEQFVREARSAASLVHHAIVQIFQVGVAQGYAYIAMELLDGPNLDEHVKAQGPMPIAQACSLIAEAAEGLGYAHEQGILHRDIKPANLIITRRGRCKVCDFGVAQISDPNDKFKLPYNVVGTPYYLSPEAARGQSSPNADLWALAASLWFMLTGKPPFVIKSPADARRLHIEIPLPDIRQIRPDIPEGLAHLLERALALEINRRYHSGDELAEALRPFTVAGDGIPVAAPAAQTDTATLAKAASVKPDGGEGGAATAVGTRRRRRRNTVPLLVGGAFVLMLMLVIGGVVTAMVLSRMPRHDPVGQSGGETAVAAAASAPTSPSPSEPTPDVRKAKETEPVIAASAAPDSRPVSEPEPKPEPEIDSRAGFEAYVPSPEESGHPPRDQSDARPEVAPPTDSEAELAKAAKTDEAAESTAPPNPTEPERPTPEAESQAAAAEVEVEEPRDAPPQPLDIQDSAAIAGAVKNHLGKPYEVSGKVVRAGDYLGDWHLILESPEALRVVVAGDAGEAVEAKLDRPILSLNAQTIRATGPLALLDDRADRPLIRVTDAEQISLLQSP